MFPLFLATTLLLIGGVKSENHAADIILSWVASVNEDKLCFSLILDADEHDQGGLLIEENDE